MINYVSLGDSIAKGTIYPGKTNPSFVDYFHDYLIRENLGGNVYLKRFERDGHRTNDLLLMLKEKHSIKSAISEADIITLSIGGNNLMQAAKDKNSITGYDWNNIDLNVANRGLNDFTIHWPWIINYIRYLNPYARLIILTVYNPYNLSDRDYRHLVDSYLFRAGGRGINDIIKNNRNLGYEIVDVYSSFDNYFNKMGDITYFYPNNLDPIGNITRNPHPKPEGHQIIYELVRKAYLRINMSTGTY